MVLVAPDGWIVLLNTVAEVANQDSEETAKLVDGVDDTDPEQCFTSQSEQPTAITVSTRTAKFVSHVQILPSQDPNSGKYSCNKLIFDATEIDLYRLTR